MRELRLAITVVVLVTLGAPVRAQNALFSGLIKQAQEDPNLLNDATSKLAETAGFGKLLSALNFRFKAFEVEDGESGLGFEWDFSKAIQSGELGGSTDPLALAFAFHSRGNYAFNQSVNPDDFLDTGLQLHLWQSRGGLRDDSVNSTEGVALLQELINKSAEFEGTPDELDANPAWIAFRASLMEKLWTQYFWDVRLNVAYESNQDFSSDQLAFGALAGGLIRAWNPDSNWAKFNLLDYPFALTRKLTGTDDEFTPSGRNLPVVLVGIDLIEATDNEVREAAGETDESFFRWRAEVGMRGEVASGDWGDIWMSASYRWYQEINPSSVIKGADLDRHGYFAAVLELPKGFRASYTTGKLPIDHESDQVFGLGWQLKFD